MKLIVTRHGETVENILGVMQGHLPGRLSESGKEQAVKLAARLKDEEIDFIYSSDLKRAVDTVKEVAGFHPKTPLILVKELRERNHGEFAGKKKSEVDWNEETTKKFWSTTESPEDGESWGEVYERAKKILENIIAKHKKDTVLLLSHGWFTNALTAVIKKLPATEIRNVDKLANTAVNVFEMNEEGNVRIVLYNCNKHLV